MGQNVIRLGDETTHGGRVITASSRMIVGGKKVVLVGDLVSCPKEGHGTNKIIEGSKSCFSDGKAMAINGALCECGCKLISSIKTMEIN